jgi:hypothetical protein
MGKAIVLVILGGVGFAWYNGWLFAPRKAQQQTQALDPLADRAARLKAEQDRIYAEESARPQSVKPQATPAGIGVAPTGQIPRHPWQSAGSGPAPGSREGNCATARNNVQVTGDWMRQGGTVHEKGSKKRLSENDSFDAAARNRQYVEENCR